MIRNLIIASIVGAVAASASASTLTLTFNGVGPSKTLSVNYSSSRSYNQDANGGFQNFTAGLMKWHDQFGRNLKTFCTQIKETISNNQTVAYTLTSVENVPDPLPGPMGALRGKLMRDLYAKHYATVKNSNNNNLNSAFQLAIWEITHENITSLTEVGAIAQLDVFSGALASNESNAVTNTVGLLAMNLLATLGDGGFQDFGASMVGLTHPERQDQIIVVPIPLTAGLAGLGLIGAAALRRRLR